MKLEAIKHQGARTDLTSSQDGNKRGKLSVEIVAEQAGESKNQIFRYIRLTELAPDLLDMVDGDKIALIPPLSFPTEPKKEPDKVTLQGSKIKDFFPPNYTPQLMEEVILRQLASWHRKCQQAAQ